MPKMPANINSRVGQFIEGGVIERETVKKVKQANPARRIEFEIGDALQDDFYPQWKTKHWDNEVNFSARFVCPPGDVEQHSNKLAYRSGSTVARFYEKDTGDEDGGFEFDVVLEEKPSTNVLTWTLQHKDLDFFYQPELTPDEIAEGSTRPENVVGSYAVYHKTKKHNRVGDKKYRTGKAFHIYRPYAEDSSGDRVWCELHIDPVANEMTVTIPQDWLDTADFSNGVIVDPTFGYTSIGATSTSSTSANNYLCTATSTEAGSVTKLSKYDGASTSTSNHIAIIYDDSSGPNALVAQGTETSLDTTDQWNDLAISASVSSGTYYVGWANETNTAYRYDTGATYYRDTSQYTPLDPWAGGVSGDRQISVYATYTAAGSTYTLTAAAGTISISGTASGLIASRSLTAAAGTISISGPATGLTVDRTLTAAAGSITLTGVTATLTYSGGACILLQETGNAILQETTDNINLESCDDGPIGYSITAAAGSFTFTGVATGLTIARTISASTRSFTFTGTAATFTITYTLTAAAGSFSISGPATGLTVDRTLTAAAGTINLSGSAAALDVARTLSATSATLTVTGSAALFSVSRTMTASAGSFTFTGTAAGFFVGYGLLASSKSLTFTGVATGLTYSAAGNIKYWDGAQWQVATLKYWDGAQWLPTTLKRYNGVTWEEISY